MIRRSIVFFRNHWAPLACGVVAALGQAPWSLWSATFVGFAVFWAHCPTHLPMRQAFAQYWVFGLGYFALGLSWIIEPFLVDIAIHGWMAPFALVAMAGGMALFWGAAGLGHWLAGPWGAVAGLGIAEWMRGHVLTGFPWGMPAYGILNTPAIGWLAVLGPYGTTLALFILAAFLAGALRARRWGRGVLALAVTVAFVFTPMLWRQPTQSAADAVTVRLVQPNAPQHQKWDPAFAPQFFARQLAATAQTPHPDIILWPESAIAALLNYAPDMVRDIQDAAQGTPVIFGALRFDDQDRLKNALVVLDDQEIVDIYDKSHLVPFGEYLPFEPVLARIGFGFFADLFGVGFVAGSGPRVLTLPNGSRILPLICYELIFPDLVRGTAQRPDFIVQLTNDAWFGDWSGPYQHLDQARARAVENGVPVLRVANTGISAVIAPNGDVIQHLPLNERGSLDTKIPKTAKNTLYRQYGDIFGALLCAVTIFGAALGRCVRKPLTKV